jgi:hypothetical protein
VTADAGATGPTPETRSGREGRRGRAPFELLGFSAAPVPGGLVVVELEGRFTTTAGRFARQPVLVVEAAQDRPRLELAPVRTALDDGRWRAVYAIPAESYNTARFALGLRGTLLDLPAPDEPPDGDRLVALAREANTLRRQLEAAEAAAASARAEVSASAAELGAAVIAARDEARAESSARLAESAERIAALEHDVAEAHRRSAEDAAELRTAHESALADLNRRHDQALADAEARADERVRAATADADARAQAAEEGIAVLRAELAEERERAPAPPATADADQTQVLPAVEPDEEDDTRPFTVAEERDVETRPLGPARREPVREPVVPDAPRRPAQRSAGAWIAVAALALFAFVLLGLLLGFLA